MTATVRDARPSAMVVRVLNPIMRMALRTPLGKMIGPLAMLEFAGRRSGRRFRVPVGWHVVGDEMLVFSPASWRLNFLGGADVVVYHRGRARQMSGSLVTDHADVARALASVLADGTSARALGLDIAEGHIVTGADIAAVDRMMIRLVPRADRTS